MFNAVANFMIPQMNDSGDEAFPALIRFYVPASERERARKNKG